MNNHLLVPFLIGQRRDGLRRVTDLDRHEWDVVDVPDFTEATLSDPNEKLRRMGRIYADMAERVERIVDAGQVPVSISGDCMSTLGMLGGLQRSGRPPDRILWLDAHGDFHTWETTQTKYLGGMPLAILVGRGDRRKQSRDSIGAMLSAIGVMPFPEQQVILSDARDLDPGELEAVRRSGITCCSIAQIGEHVKPGERLYLHFDSDVMDAEADIPALKYHVKSGPGYADMAALFRSLRGPDIVAVSVSAWHEEKDLDNAAARACLALLGELEMPK
ncbi:arginase family protein [Duganella violaceipulchra]|uniref:Arginase n=1 Tax=Duganella violaceipulchra TaxID=2849652 RepID=A0AA41H749_9BURK|nr:arginase family protein [Duganella violaceicalia]MBV6320615.1 arginase family protein [Duganella violaceicalia]MCP2008676.1 arginase [Duganella violaceicalia]